MNDNRQTFVLKNFLEIMRECRHQMVADVLHYNHDLYNFLCADRENVRVLYKQLYELKWMQSHWQKCDDRLKDTHLELAARREVMKIFLRRYLAFAEAWNYKPENVAVINAKIDAIDIMIQTEEQWSEQFNALTTSFMLETKRLDKLIEEASL